MPDKDNRQMRDELASIASQLREEARDMYLATLLMPKEVAPLATALFSFHVELTNIAKQVSEPMAGAIRLQWWAEVLTGERTGEGQGHPLARSLLQLLNQHDLASQFLANKAHAHEFDLFAEPMESRAMFEGYMGETRSVLFQLLAMAANKDGIGQEDLATASGHAGVSTGIVAVLFDLSRQRQFRQIFVPQDVLRAVGLTDEAYLQGDASEIGPAVSALIDLGWDHHEKAVAAIEALPSSFRQIFSLCSLTPTYLKKAEASIKKGHFDLQPLSQLRTQWLMYRQKL